MPSLEPIYLLPQKELRLYLETNKKYYQIYLFIMFITLKGVVRGMCKKPKMGQGRTDRKYLA